MDQKNLKQSSFLKQFLHEKTQFCNHEGSCLMNALRGLVKSFGLGFAIKSVVHVLTSMLSYKKRKQSFIKGFFEKDFYYLSLFFCSQTCLLKAIQCLMRKITKKESGYNAFLSGFLSSLFSMYFYQSKTNIYNWRMLAYMRVIEGMYYQLVNRGYIQKNSLHFTLMYSIGSFLISYSIFSEGGIAQPDMNLTPDEKIYHYVLISRAEKALREKGIE